MMSDEVTQSQILCWIKSSMERQNLKNLTMDLNQPLEKTDGYATYVIFVKVTGVHPDGSAKEFNLVLKVSKQFKEVAGPVDAVFKQEVFMYEHLFPAFKTFESHKRIKDTFDNVPKCYKTLVSNGRYVLVLENLRKLGYVPFDRSQSLNINHLKLILKTYAKYHALSFAFKDQNRSEFNNLVDNHTSTTRTLLQTHIMGIFKYGSARTCELLRRKDGKLAQKFEKVLQKGAENIMREIWEEEIDKVVMTHGDSWCGNFLFKYKDNNKTCPTEVAIVDFQISILHSPALDLSYLLFINSSKEEVPKFNELLKYYHEHLSCFLTELGSDPKKLFPFTTLLEHWKKYAINGLLYLSLLEMLMLDKNNDIDVAKFGKAEDFAEGLNEIPCVDHKAYEDRIVSLTKYYFDLVKE